ncbi:hypothetical protein [Micromonospora pattaloongensis]|uniref:hypothetical protein n=1 Tax=Micromonospora pattaloongensis TaxID=405436 RepID=UPI001587D809|nr:hypothetical protein [Micromonospora pattaloongensis]
MSDFPGRVVARPARRAARAVGAQVAGVWIAAGFARARVARLRSEASGTAGAGRGGVRL